MWTFLFGVSFWIDLPQRTIYLEGMCWRLTMWCVRPYAVGKRIGIIYFFSVITTVDCGSWFRIGLILLRCYLEIYILMLISFVFLEGFQRNLWLLFLLFGYPFYLLSGKIATGEFSKIISIILKLFWKGLNPKRIGGWKQTTFCSLLITSFWDKIHYVVYRLSCTVM